MAPSVQKLTLNAARAIPFNKLVLSQANVRRLQAGQSIEDLAEDIARRSLLTSLTVRPVRDEAGAETGLFEVPAGGRRYRALEHLVKTKRLARNAGVPCIVVAAEPGHTAEEDSLAENLQRVALHPLDQFRAFQTLHAQGLGEEAIAARFFVSTQIVRQRLKLARVSPTLLDLYAQDGLSLEQLMAFTVSDDHARQEEVWSALARSYTREPYAIRRMLTETAVRGSDKRAQYVGLAAYEAAGGVTLRDLFAADDGGGWLQDVALLDRLTADRLAEDARRVRAEGWRWVEVAPDLPYGHTIGLRRLRGDSGLSPEEQASHAALQQEAEAIEAAHAAAEELPDAADRRLGEIEAMLDALDERPPLFAPEEIAQAGAFVSLDASGRVRVERGYVRPDDEAGGEAPATGETAAGAEGPDALRRAPAAARTDGAASVDPAGEDEAGASAISDRLLADLTAARTLGLRDALARHPDTALLALLHALTLRIFYRGSGALDSCLEIEARHVDLTSTAPGLADNPAAAAIAQRHAAWSQQLPPQPRDLWDTLLAFDHDSRRDLLAHCTALSLNAVVLPYDRRTRALSHADRLAEQVGLDMTASFTPGAANYFGRTTKTGILAAVREAKGEASAQLIAHLRKADMAAEAERLVAGTGWLPRPLRTTEDGAERPSPAPDEAEDGAVTEPSIDLPAFLTEPDSGGTPGAGPWPQAAE
jgi:ParB family chromosome partitioning protein